jgi:predicted heme/steroid binding protein
MKIFYNIILIMILCIISCGTNANKNTRGLPDIVELPNFIYVAGNYYDEDIEKACYWQDGERKILPIPFGTKTPRVYSITVEDGIVYTAGSYIIPFNWKEMDVIYPSVSPGFKYYNASAFTYPVMTFRPGIYKACYWKDAVRVDLPIPEGAEGSRAYDIALLDNTVYTVGGYYTRNDWKPCYWKDTTRIDLPIPDRATGSSASLIAVENGIIYITGTYTEDRTTKLCYWKDAVRTDIALPERTGYHERTGIAVENETVYISGRIVQGDDGTWRACYWQGSTLVELPTPEGTTHSMALDVTVVDGIVYTTGYHSDQACYWKNTTRVDLPAPGVWKTNVQTLITGRGESGRAIAVINGNVYIMGYSCYWENEAYHYIGHDYGNIDAIYIDSK